MYCTKIWKYVSPRNPFDVDRAGLVRHLGKLSQAFSRLMRSGASVGSAPAAASSTAVATLADMYELAGETHHEVSMHEMGDYQSYKERQARLPESSSPPLRELEEAPVRLHAFGNPFKVAKVSARIQALFWHIVLVHILYMRVGRKVCRTHQVFSLSNNFFWLY